MTKKTDSLIFRYGINALWKNTNFLFKTSISGSFFFKFIQSDLQKRHVELLCIEHSTFNVMYAFVFCFFFKKLNVKKKLLKSKSITSLLFKSVIFYTYWFKFQILYSGFLILHLRKLIVFTLDMYLLSACFKLYIYFLYKKDYKYSSPYKSLTILFFKVEQLRLESLISVFFNWQLHIKLQNIFNLPIYFDFIHLPRFTVQTQHSLLTTLEFTLYLACKLRKCSIIAKYLAKQLVMDKRHSKLLWQLVRAVKFLNKELSLFKGLKLYVTGKLNGKMRRKAYSFSFGKVPMQQIKSNLDFFKSTSFTKFGTISIKFWLFF